MSQTACRERLEALWSQARLIRRLPAGIDAGLLIFNNPSCGRAVDGSAAALLFIGFCDVTNSRSANKDLTVERSLGNIRGLRTPASADRKLCGFALTDVYFVMRICTLGVLTLALA